MNKILRLLVNYFNIALRNLKKSDKIVKSVIGHNVILSHHLMIKNTKLYGQVKIGSFCRLSECFISGNVEIGDHTSIFGPNTELLSKINAIRIGKYSSIAKNVNIQEYNHKYKKISTYYMSQNIFNEDIRNDLYSNGDIIIGNDVWIGAHAVILSGSIIGDGAIIGANAVVTGAIPEYAIVAGSPARVIKYRFDPEIINYLKKLSWWDLPKEFLIENKEIFKKENFSITDLELLYKKANLLR